MSFSGASHRSVTESFVVKVVKTTKDSVTLQWEAPLNDNGSPVIGYVVEKSKFNAKTDDEVWERANEELVEELEYTCSDLEKGDYEFRVRSVNLAGESEPRMCVELVTPTEKKEEPQFLIDVDHKPYVEVHAGRKLQFQAHFRGNPEPHAQFGRVGEEILSEDAIVTVSDSQATLTINQCKLSDGGKYSLTVQNEVGSKQLFFTAKVCGPPGQVGPIHAKEIMLDAVLLSWSEPRLDGYALVEKYIVEYCDVSTQRWMKSTVECARTSHKVTGLVEGQRYLFRVTAVNVYGAGEPRVTEENIKTSQVPSCPVDVGVVNVSLIVCINF